ncbi:SUMF1/EgtB/PvdO family nonheme iron enzyme [Candidatus Chlorohelix sp.]|uniref:formylglycine-generating enzyme family protein n=1 Tax=Candidatus Chlorohelix sp. TaxID=3139201 RepID=UPI0030288A1B
MQNTDSNYNKLNELGKLIQDYSAKANLNNTVLARLVGMKDTKSVSGWIHGKYAPDEKNTYKLIGLFMSRKVITSLVEAGEFWQLAAERNNYRGYRERFDAEQIQFEETKIESTTTEKSESVAIIKADDSFLTKSSDSEFGKSEPEESEAQSSSILVEIEPEETAPLFEKEPETSSFLLLRPEPEPKPVSRRQDVFFIQRWGVTPIVIITVTVLLVTALLGSLALLLTPGLVASTTNPLSVIVDNMAFIPEGNFIQGSTLEELQKFAALCSVIPKPDCQIDFFTDELLDDPKPGLPHRQVYLSAFYIDVYEVTNAQFERFVKATGYVTTAEKAGQSEVFNNNTNQYATVKGAYWSMPGGPGTTSVTQPNYPVVHISFEDAQSYCAWDNKKRLPTDAEWEKATRGPVGNLYPWGNEWNPNAGNWVELLPNGDTHIKGLKEVGKFPAGKSYYGLYDTLGNVSEWIADAYNPDFYRTAPLRNPFNAPIDGQKVQHSKRGGGWATRPGYLHVAWRIDRPDSTNDTLGFRCARNP